MSSLFEPFFTTRQEGAGLGMAISYSIIIGHGGDIGVQSQVGRGSGFTIKLPTKPSLSDPPGEEK